MKGVDNMKKLTGLCVLLLGLALAGCASHETKPAAVEQAGGAQGQGAQAGNVAGQNLGANDLNNPHSIHAKRSVYFDLDSSTVSEEYKPIVQAHARYLSDHPQARVQIQGNCDERGSSEYNLALGQRRADAVKQMMMVLGVPPQQIETISYGKEKPKCTEHDESCWAQNRRDDIVYQHP
jgi:peptidoglycan-associated lipoprotein